MKTVAISQHQPRCFICQSGRAADWNRLYQAFLNAQPSPITGEKLSWPILARNASVIAGRQVSAVVARRHAEKHTEVIDDGEAVPLEEKVAPHDAEALELFERILGPNWWNEPASPDKLLELHRVLYVRGLADDVKAGRTPKLGHDQITRSISEATKRKSSEATQELLNALSGGISKHFQNVLGPPPDIVDVEAEALEELPPGDSAPFEHEEDAEEG